MERQEQTLQKQTAPKETNHKEIQQQEQRSFPALALQAIADGSPVWDLPRHTLEELAERVGNSAMLSLTAMQAPETVLYRTELAGAEPQTETVEVPEMACSLEPAADLTAGFWPSGAFDPAGLA